MIDHGSFQTIFMVVKNGCMDSCGANSPSILVSNDSSWLSQAFYSAEMNHRRNLGPRKTRAFPMIFGVDELQIRKPGILMPPDWDEI